MKCFTCDPEEGKLAFWPYEDSCSHKLSIPTEHELSRESMQDSS